MARLLGIQVSSSSCAGKTWELTLQQLRARMYFAEVKTTDKDWHGGWLHCSYHHHHDLLQPLQAHQATRYGSFNFHTLMASRVFGDAILLTSAGEGVKLSDLTGLATSGDTIGDIIDIEWLAVGSVSCRSKRLDFPLAPRPARSFKWLCDLLVFNYPAILAPRDPIDILRLEPHQFDTWRLRKHEGASDLLWESTRGVPITTARIHDQKSASRALQSFLGDAGVHAADHHWFSPPHSIWSDGTNALSSSKIKAKIHERLHRAGRSEVMARVAKVESEDDVIGLALATITWKDLQNLQGTTSSERLLLHRIKSGRLTAWDRLHKRRGCPHCTHLGTESGEITHMFWRCPMAQLLWCDVKAAWQSQGIWLDEGQSPFVAAIFSLKLTSFPPALWSILELARVQRSSTESVINIHKAAAHVWQQQVLATLRVLWRWWNNIEDDCMMWSDILARAYLAASLRAATLSSVAMTTTTAPCDLQGVLRHTLAAAISEVPDTPVATADGTRRILFFDGGSTGNPGPGGSGAVIVETDECLLAARIAWSASMSYAQDTTTNNQAEFNGLIVGLQAAHDRKWRYIHVVGDSMLVLNQMRHYRPPRNRTLRALYGKARWLADRVQVVEWRHHLRAHNKMADAAANIAMDTRTSVQSTPTSGRSEHAAISTHLSSYFQHWQTNAFQLLQPLDT